MPKVYENKAIHNETFLYCINNDYPNEYFDWKVTIQFYTALHKCYCVLLTKNFTIHKSHKDNIDNIKTIDQNLSTKLHKVYKHSRQSRYDGFLTEDSMNRINKINYTDGVRILNDINNLVAQYYPVPAPVAV
ncbi:hypothetical protein [Flavobacterium sp. J27]|uniref:hypothetical protein n=1 Tax=Flavobacterium sp. J27 TaxID=2060419 RepID=UPI001030F21D|nr:hypothetical protein [Flavobacterium sp. J27]